MAKDFETFAKMAKFRPIWSPWSDPVRPLPFSFSTRQIHSFNFSKEDIGLSRKGINTVWLLSRTKPYKNML